MDMKKMQKWDIIKRYKFNKSMTKQNNKDPIMVLLGEYLRYHRRLKQITLKELALKLKIPYQMLTRYERGLSDMPYSRLYKICKILEISGVINFDENRIKDVLKIIK